MALQELLKATGINSWLESDHTIQTVLLNNRGLTNKVFNAYRQRNHFEDGLY